ncbi:MAG TPA: 6-pyruvoyl-tetrahydropterin synthase-related protein [bacterium]|nr:6-pyruvoyl-tetrahydropterin synthase-related protein [bacterium]
MKRVLFVLLIAMILLIAAQPLLAPYQHAGHSAYVDLSRAQAFHQAVVHGDFTPRWIMDFYFGYGSPIFNFYAPLTYYAIEMFRLIGLDALWALKLTYLLFWLLAAWAMFRLVSEVIDPDGALAAAAVYSVAPYLLVDVYVRAGIAEFSCFAFVPLTLLGVWRSARDTSSFGPLLAALGLAGLTCAHNITALVTAPFYFLLALLVAENSRALIRTWGALALGMALAAFFWLPAIAEKNTVGSLENLTGGFFDFHNHFLYPAQLFLRKWGFGGSAPGPNDEMGFMFGELLWLGVVLAPAALMFTKLRNDAVRFRATWFFFGATAIFLLMTQPLTRLLWEHLPLLPFVQFPWRFLLPATAFGAVLIAVLPAVFNERVRPWIAVGIALAALASSAGYLTVRYVFHDTQHNAMVFTNRDQAALAQHDKRLVRPDLFLSPGLMRQLGVTSTARDDYLPIGCTKPPQRMPEQPLVTEDSQTTILSAAYGYPYIRAEVKTIYTEKLVFNQFYFPGWQATVDGIPTELLAEPETGRMVLVVGPGRHAIDIRFKDTLLRTFAKLVSIFALIIFGIWAWVALQIRRDD